ncbi:MAG TPA: alpha/beta hydrolase [Actinomycetes bacterium]|nr:alpha/beta hydrolase [Actinomycetes bacterium]
MTSAFLDGVTDSCLTRPDGRVVAWTEWGGGSTPVLRVPGTPGSRFGLRSDRSVWAERDLRVITTERPGFGASTPLPGRGFAEHADDLAAVLDRLEIESLHVEGGSGAAPHELAFAARHPDRVKAMTIVVGVAPCIDDEVAGMIPINQEGYRLVQAGDRPGAASLLWGIRDELLADPLGGIRRVMEHAPAADQQVMSNPRWQEGHVAQLNEALAQGVQGWADEIFANWRPWMDFNLSDVTTSVTWWHAASDANCPLSAAERLVAQLPNARLVRFGDDEGHLAAYHREAEILDELFTRR